VSHSAQLLVISKTIFPSDVLTATKIQALGSKEDVQGQEVAVLQIVYVGSLIHSTTQSSPDTSQAE